MATTPVPPFAAPPDFPALSDRASGTYNSKAFAWAEAMQDTTGPNIHALAVTAKANADEAANQSTAAVATASQAVTDTEAIKTAAVSETTAIKDAAVSETAAIKDQARGYRDDAAISALAAQGSANFKGDWSSLVGALVMPATVRHAGKFWVLLNNVPNVATAEPGVSAAWAKTSAGAPLIAYDSRATLRVTSGATGDQALVGGLGLFAYQDASDEPDDDESCFATATGRWLLQAAHWDLVDAWQLPEVEERDAYDEDEPLRFASSFASSFAAKVITGSATCAITSVAATASTSFTGTVTGAAVGDRVIATPPAELGATAAETGRLGYHAFVSAANTVTVMLTNASAAAANTRPAIRTAWPITVIKS